MEEEKVLEPIIFTHEEFGEIHTFWIDGNPYFIGKEVATKLGYKDTVNALKDHVKDKHKLGWQIATSGQRRNMTLISEAGLYTLILKSTLPAAEKFQDWVTEEVLPSLRKTGSYTMPGNDDAKNFIFNFGNDNMSAASLKKGCGEELGRLSRMLGNIAALNPAQLYLMNEATLCITGHYIPTLEKFTFANYYGDEKKE